MRTPSARFSVLALLACLVCGGCARDILFARDGEIHELECRDERALPLPTTENQAPRWSPDGTRFAYLGRDPAGPAIFVADRNGGDVVNLTSGEVAEPSIDFVWSPNGEYLLYTATNSTGTLSIYRVRAATAGPPLPLTPFDVNSKHPSVSPDGRRFVYSSTSPAQPNVFDLYTSNLDGMNRSVLVATPDLDDTHPAWGPDDRIVFARGSNLVFADLDGAVTVVADSRARLSGAIFDRVDPPAWSPDGNYIVYSGGTEKIYLMDTAPPHALRCLACPAGPGLNLDITPRWSGDNRIVFHRPIPHIPPSDSPIGIFVVNREGTDEMFLATRGNRPDPRPRRLRVCLGS